MTTPAVARWASLCSLVVLAACGATYPTLDARDAGFWHPTYGYLLSYRGTGQTLLGPGWEAHAGVTDTRTVPLDYDADGVLDGALDVPVFDLLYTHSASRGALFVSTFPTSREAAAGDLASILSGYITSAARAGQIAYGFPRSITRGTPPVASRLLGSRPRQVGGFPAHEVLFELADVPAAQVTESTLWRRGHVVLVRADLTFSDQQYSRARGSSTAAFYPVLLVLGYANSAAEFAAQHDDFEDLVARLRFPPDPAVQPLAAQLAACVTQATLVEFLVLPEGRVGAHAVLADEASMRCVSQTLVHATLPRAVWPRTYALRVAPAASAPVR